MTNKTTPAMIERLTAWRDQCAMLRIEPSANLSTKELRLILATLEAALAYKTAVTMPDTGDGGRACYEAERRLLDTLEDIDA